MGAVRERALDDATKARAVGGLDLGRHHVATDTERVREPDQRASRVVAAAVATARGARAVLRHHQIDGRGDERASLRRRGSVERIAGIAPARPPRGDRRVVRAVAAPALVEPRLAIHTHHHAGARRIDVDVRQEEVRARQAQARRRGQRTTAVVREEPRRVERVVVGQERRLERDRRVERHVEVGGGEARRASRGGSPGRRRSPAASSRQAGTRRSR